MKTFTNGVFKMRIQNSLDDEVVEEVQKLLPSPIAVSPQTLFIWAGLVEASIE